MTFELEIGVDDFHDVYRETAALLRKLAERLDAEDGDSFARGKVYELRAFLSDTKVGVAGFN